jgi:hypothetical protein
MKDIVCENIVSIMQDNNIKNLVITGAPFSLLWYGALIKKSNQGIRYIADIRDSWLDNDFYGYGLLGKTRRKKEYEKFKFVIENSDIVFVPYQNLLNTYQKFSDKVALLPHGVDDDFVEMPRSIDSKRFRLVHFGSQYHHLDKEFEFLAKVLKANPDIRVDFFTKDTNKYSKYFINSGTLDRNCFYNDIVSEKTVFMKMSESSAVLLFTPNYMRDYISTKYLEIIAARVPIIIIGEEGEASKFVVQNNLGVFIDSSKFSQERKDLKKIIAGLKYNEKFDLQPYLFSEQTKMVESYLLV